MNILLAKASVMLTIVLASAGAANAVPVTINMTGDNILDGGGLCFDATCTGGTGWEVLGIGLGNASNWRLSDSIEIDLAPGTHWFTWHVTNVGTAASGNPAALLAQILWSGGANYSSSHWEIFDAGTGEHVARATQYGANGGANIWTAVNGASVVGISSAANWIWSENNFASAARVLWIRTSISVPEPATLGLLGVTLLGFGLVRLRRRA